MRPAKKTTAKLISKQQTKFIKTIQRQHLDDSEYYEVLQNRFRVKSCTDLTSRQASILIRLFQEWGFMGTPATKARKPKVKRARHTNRTGQPRMTGNVIRLASVAEKEKIKALSGLITWSHTDGFKRWTVKRFGLFQVKTSRDAYQVIEGLKKMFENRMKKQHGPTWWGINFDDENIKKYIQYHCPEEYR